MGGCGRVGLGDECLAEVADCGSVLRGFVALEAELSAGLGQLSIDHATLGTRGVGEAIVHRLEQSPVIHRVSDLRGARKTAVDPVVHAERFIHVTNAAAAGDLQIEQPFAAVKIVFQKADVVAEDRQYCLVHLLRELEKVDDHNDSVEWQAFAKKLRRFLRDGIRLRRREDFSPGKYGDRIDQLNRRLADLAAEEHVDGDTRRLTNRLRKYAEYLFTFLDHVPFENNFAERQIRPAVILRKNPDASGSNRSDQGAATQAVLMSVYRTLRLRGRPHQDNRRRPKTYLTAGHLSPLPA